MKKRITLALSMLLVMLMLVACGTDPTTVNYNGRSYDELKTEAETSINWVSQVAGLYSANQVTADSMTDDMTDSLLTNYGSYGLTQQMLDGGFAWNDSMDELGEYVEADMDSFTVTKSGNTLTTDVTLKFKDRDAIFEVVYSYYNMEMTGINVNPVYSMGETMSKAGMNTLISISIVFAVLILISLIISCFKIFPYIEKKRAEKKAANAPAPAVEQPASENTVAQPLTDDTELVAVIAAAIAASTGTSTSDFVVRSINRR